MAKRGMRGQNGSGVRTNSIVKHRSYVVTRPKVRRPIMQQFSAPEYELLTVFDDHPCDVEPTRIRHTMPDLRYYDDTIDLDFEECEQVTLHFGQSVDSTSIVPMVEPERPQVMTVEEWRR